MYKYLREDIKKIKPYEVKEIKHRIKLDANEGINWVDDLNRYPNDRCDELRHRLAEYLNGDSKELLIGNGSSELIEYCMKAYLEANETVVSISPSFSMYEIYTVINKGVYKQYPLDNMKKLNTEGFIEFIKDKKAKLVILGNPNNPTGTMIPRREIYKIIDSVNAMVILDEAYIEFADDASLYDTGNFKNLIVLRTFSKAMALAGVRLGYMIAHREVIGYINRVKTPYNVNTLSQTMGMKALDNMDIIKANIQIIKSERARVKKKLEEYGLKPLPSQTNFLFFSGDRNLGEKLTKKGILIRCYSGNLEGYYRITIGKPEENNVLLKAIEEVQNEKSKNVQENERDKY